MSAREQLERLLSNLLNLGARRLATLALLGMGIAAIVGFGSYYLSRPAFENLYTGLNTQDVSRIGAALSEAGIPFDVAADGTAVLVAYNQTARARTILAERGLPASANSGYELFDKLGSMGLTSFMQDITRVRALEGEIARTIQSMKGVKAARVHLVMAGTGSFRRTQQPPSASVVIRTENAGDATAAQAIQQLVASAVPGMTINYVTVLSTEGTVLAAGGDSFLANSGRMAGLEKRVSSDMQDNVRRTLMPYLGLGNFEVSVTARLNTDKRQINETKYNPDGRVERSVRSVKDTGSSQNAARNWATGVEQNVPAEGSSAQSGGDQSKRQTERREETVNYEINTKTTATVSEGYKIEKLAVAVVINRKRLAAVLGANASPGALEARIKEVERLVTSAAGADTKRGDQITVEAVEFAGAADALEPVPGPPVVDQLLHYTGAALNSLTVLVVTILLIWFGLKPALKVIAEQPKLPQSAATPLLSVPGSPGARAPGTPGAAAGLPAPEDTAPPGNASTAPARGLPPTKRLEQAVQYNEQQAAALLKQWMRE